MARSTIVPVLHGCHMWMIVDSVVLWLGLIISFSGWRNMFHLSFINSNNLIIFYIFYVFFIPFTTDYSS